MTFFFGYYIKESIMITKKEHSLHSFYRFDTLSLERATLIHAITQRDTRRDYDASMALHTGEKRPLIVANRWRVAHEIIAKEDLSSYLFVVANQTHSDHIKIITKKEMLGWESMESAVEDCDALITDLPRVVLNILTADCVPILLYDPHKKVVAAIHAGWRGSHMKIVEKSISMMQSHFGSSASDILAGIGPAIGKCCYEVDRDVAKHFDAYPQALEQKAEKYMLDLIEINKIQLIASGLKEQHIETSGICTSCQVERYFSYRKELGCSGRFMSMIGLK